MTDQLKHHGWKNGNKKVVLNGNVRVVSAERFLQDSTVIAAELLIKACLIYFLRAFKTALHRFVFVDIA